MVVTDYLPVYTWFVQNQLDSLVTHYCYTYKIYGNRQYNCREEVLSDIGVTFCYTCKYARKKLLCTDFMTYLKAALTHAVKYSILRQARYEQNCQKDSAYYLHKFGKSLNGHLIDIRIKDPSEDCFRLNYNDFNFSPLNTTEKEIIQFFFWENMKISEISKTLNISESTVRQSKKRALKKLKHLNRHLLN